MNPHIIKCLYKGYEERVKQEDYLQYIWWGNYGLSAVSVAVEHRLAGKKAKSKYIEKPILSKIEQKKEQGKLMTEEEKKKQTEQLFMRLRIMGANFNLNKEKEK